VLDDEGLQAILLVQVRVQMLLHLPSQRSTQRHHTHTSTIASRQSIFPQLYHPFPLSNPILFLGIPCALVKLMD
jgi:hypothetical protein